MGDLRSRLKTAVDGTPVPVGLATRVRARIASEARNPWLRPGRLVPAGALLAALVAGVGLYRGGYLPMDMSDQAEYIARVSEGVPALLQVGLGDHLHCALFRQYPKNGPTPAQFAESMGAKYGDLVRILERNTPAGYRMKLAHECHYKSRGFVHLVIGDGQRMLSLAITARKPGESLASNADWLQEAGAARFRVSGFATDRFLVYTVSDLPGEANGAILRTMAPEIRGALAKI